MSQAYARVHYGNYGTSAPTTGTWAVGDIAMNNNPVNGGVAYWICTAAGPPATWVAGTAAVNGIGINDTTGYVLSSTGTANITGVSHIRLDTFGGAALDTATTLTGRTGQIVFISIRNDARDIVFIDSENQFNLDQGKLTLRNSKDVLGLLALSSTQWKQIFYSGTLRNERFTVDDSTEFVLTAPGAANVSGFGNVILDTFGAAALDTVTTLTGNIGQIAYISSRNNNRDLIFLDGTNFSLDRASIKLRSSEDVAVFKATSATSWKLMAFSGNTLNEKFTVDDTTGFVLAAAGAATITGVSNVILDTFGAVALDTCTTLTGTVGQIVYISTRNGNRDIVFLDGTNFRLNSAKVHLHSQEDVLVLKATTSTIWKQIGWLTQNFDNNRFTIDDTTGVVLSASGTGTVSGIGNLVLDTFGAAAADTAVTLTGNIGQIVYIRTRSSSRDILFRDLGTFALQADRLLDHVDDVLALIATTATIWKELFFANNN